MSEQSRKLTASTSFEHFLGDVSMRLLDAAASGTRESVDTAMGEVMSDVGERYGIDRVLLRGLQVEEGAAPIYVSWARPTAKLPRNYSLQEVPWLSATVLSGQPVCIDNLDDLPPEASVDRALLEAETIHAALVVPLSIDEDLVGALSLTNQNPFHWTRAIRSEMISLSAMLATAYWGAESRVKLKESEARYRAVVQDQTELIMRWTPGGTTTWVNDACCEYLETYRDRLVGSKKLPFVSDEDWPELQDAIARLTPRNPVNTGERQVRLPSGEIAWQEWTDRGIFDDSGVLVEIQSVGRDITVRKTAEETIARTAESQRQRADLLAGLTSMNQGSADQTMGRSLARIGELYNAAFVHVWYLSQEDASFGWQHRWLAKGSKPVLESDSIDESEVQWLTSQLRSGKKVVVQDANQLPADADTFKRFLHRAGCDTCLGFPLIVDDANFGFCTFAATHANTWDDLAIDELEAHSNTMAIAISRFRALEELGHRAAFQSLLAAITSRLMEAEVEHTNEIIVELLELIGKEYDFDRVNVTWHDEALPGFGAPIDWVPDGEHAPEVHPQKVPVGYSLLMRGEMDLIDAVAEMPQDAREDQAFWQELGFSSILGLPLIIKGRVFGSAGFGRREQRSWSENTIQELQLIVGALAVAVVRQWSNSELMHREKALARSQQVAGVGSFSATGKLDEDGATDILEFSMSDQALKIFSMENVPDILATINSRFHPDDEARIWETWRQTLNTGTYHDLEYRIIKPDGSMAYIQSRVDVDHVDENGVATIFGTYKDVTEWVESNQELQLALSEIGKLKDELQQENVLLRDEVQAAQRVDWMIGESEGFRNVLDAAAQVAPTDVTVLVTGETGTGKELVARYIHELSHRKDKVLVSVNCAALSTELITSELFGHEKGAFTGAHERRMGRFELADGGTLFLDEIGEISSDLQARLLRVIQEGEFERLGGSKTLKTDVRLIAATNRDLERAVDDGEFRADLYYRINSFPIHIPPLRDRKEDIPLLAEHFVQKHATKMGKEFSSISARTLRYLRSQSWRGNVRELEGIILRALITTTGPVLDYSEGVLGPGGTLSTLTASAGTSLHDAQREHIRDTLEKCNWVIEGKKGAAAALGLAASSLRSKMKRLGIVRPARELQQG